MNNRQLIGEFQPHMIVEGKRVPVGDPIQNYFERAIPESLFYAVQALIKDNSSKAGNAGGKTGKAKNLFTCIIKCGFCNGAMHYIDKGPGTKGGQYLHCDHSRRKLGDCNAKAVRYDEFESLFFKEVENLNIDEIMPRESEIKLHIKNLETRLASILYQIKETEEGRKNLTKSLKQADDDESIQLILTVLKETNNEIKNLQKIRAELKLEIKKASILREQFISNINYTQEVHQIMESANDELERINLRLKLRHEIRKIVGKIIIFPIHTRADALTHTKVKLQEFEQSLNDKGKITFSEKIRLNALRDKLEKLNTLNDSEAERIIASKYIDRFYIQYVGQSKIISSGIYL